MNNQIKSITLLRLAAVAALALASTATAVDLSKLPPASKQENVTFDKDIKPIFEASCARCHGADRPKAGFRVTTLEGVLKGTKDGKVVTPGKSAESDLVIAVSLLDPEMAMPPKPKAPKRAPDGGPGAAPGGPQGAKPPGTPPKPLTQEQVGLVRAWIDQGAK